MKRVVLHDIKKIKVIDSPDPAIKNKDDVLLKMSHVGVCGSDMHYYKEGKIGEQVVAYPFTIGHECSATIAAIGTDVKNLSVGQPVFVEPAIPCKKCAQCREGNEHICPNVQFLGAAGQLSGGMAGFITMPADNCFPLPENISLTEAVLIEPLSIAYHAVRYVDRKDRQQNIAILGVGPIGLSVQTVLIALHNTRLFVTDRLPYRLEISQSCGAFYTGNPETTDIVAAVNTKAPDKMDVVFECAGEQETIDQAVDMLKPGGKLVIVGIHAKDRISFEIDKVRRKELIILNVRRQNHAVKPVIELLQKNKLKIDHLITHEESLDRVQEVFEMVANYSEGVVKALIRIT